MQSDIAGEEQLLRLTEIKTARNLLCRLRAANFSHAQYVRSSWSPGQSRGGHVGSPLPQALGSDEHPGSWVNYWPCHT